MDDNATLRQFLNCYVTLKYFDSSVNPFKYSLGDFNLNWSACNTITRFKNDPVRRAIVIHSRKARYYTTPMQ